MIDMKNKGLVNKIALFQIQNRLSPVPEVRRISDEHRSIKKNQTPELKEILKSKFKCWTCGLYKGDAELCKSCTHRCGLKI